MNIFKSYTGEEEYIEALEEFLDEKSREVPVYTKDRVDLKQSIDFASKLYDSLIEAPKYDIGILITEEEKLFPVNGFMKSFADRWINVESFEDSKLNGEVSVVVCGIYEDFRYSNLRKLIFSLSRNKKIQYSFLIGRDVASLSWMCAKQFAKDTELEDEGVFTFKKCTHEYLKDLREKQDRIKLFDETSFEKVNIRETILNKAWKRVIFHGHGKDDNINLGDYTVCGNNECVEKNREYLFPRCGYDGQSCFKDYKKVIHLNKVVCSEVVMNSCNNGPFKDLACYDSKFNLLLNAIDGPAKKINACFTIQNSDIPELFNCLKNTELEKIDFSGLLHKSLDDIQVYPSFIQIGLTPRVEKHKVERQIHSELVLKTLSRAQKYIINDFMPKNHPLIKRFEAFNSQGNSYLLRGKQGLTKEEAKLIEKDWKSKIQSLDYSMAQKIIQNPEDTIMDFETYVMDRSEADKESVSYLKCTCGNHAMKFTMKGLIDNVPDLDMLFCFKCGDKTVSMKGAPIIEVKSQDMISVGGTLKCGCKITPEEEGNIVVGYFMPSYIRDYVKGEPKLVKYKNKNNSQINFEFTVDFKDDIPPQGYYLTVFAIQNLSISVTREFFGITGED